MKGPNDDKLRNSRYNNSMINNETSNGRARGNGTVEFNNKAVANEMTHGKGTLSNSEVQSVITFSQLPSENPTSPNKKGRIVDWSKQKGSQGLERKITKRMEYL